MNRKPAEVFPAGDYLLSELEKRGWNQTEFAEIIDRPSRVISEILAGKRGITPETAKAIAAALGTSAELWMKLDAAYQLSLVAPVSDRIAKEAKLREKFPVREMVKRGWIEGTKNYEIMETRILDFFGKLESIDEIPQLSHAARRNYDEEVSMIQYAWLFRVKQLANALKLPPYDEKKLRASLSDLEFLMSDPEEVRHVPKILSECGVKFVIAEPIPGSKINGVCMWDNNDSPVIGLTLKGEYIDRFWFNLRHEIEHVLRGDGKDGTLIIDEFDPTADSNKIHERERAADEAAKNFCVPDEKMTNFIVRHDPLYTEESLKGFSLLMKRHPGIVAGQLQRRLAKWTLFKKYQVKVRQILIQTALTDGYGVVPPINL